jgi:hypothetical protein
MFHFLHVLTRPSEDMRLLGFHSIIGNYTKDQEIRRLVEWCRHKDHEENNKNEESSKD